MKYIMYMRYTVFEFFLNGKYIFELRIEDIYIFILKYKVLKGVKCKFVRCHYMLKICLYM